MAEADTRIETLEDEVKVLKGEVRRTLVDLRALLMREDSPLNDVALSRRIALAETKGGNPPAAPAPIIPDVAMQETVSQPPPAAPAPPVPPPAANPMPQAPPTMAPGPPPGPNPTWAAGTGPPPGPPPGPPSVSPGFDSAAVDRERGMADQQRRLDEQERRMAEQERRIAEAAKPHSAADPAPDRERGMADQQRRLDEQERRMAEQERRMAEADKPHSAGDKADKREQPEPEPKKPDGRSDKPKQPKDEKEDDSLHVEVLLAKAEPRQEEPSNEDQDDEEYDQYGDGESKDDGVDDTLKQGLAPADSDLANTTGRSDEELKNHRLQEPKSGREKRRRDYVEDSVEEAAAAPNSNGRGSRVYEEYIGLLAETEELGVGEGEGASSPLDVNLVSSLTRWATVAKRRVGEQRSKEILELYSQSGHLTAGLRQLIEQIFKLVGESGPEAGEDAQGCLDLIFHLHGILAGGLAIRQIPLAKISA